MTVIQTFSPLEKTSFPADRLAMKGVHFMKKLKSFSKRLMKNNKGQGMVEYILLLVVVVAIVMAVKPIFSSYVQGDLFENLKAQIGGVFSN